MNTHPNSRRNDIVKRFVVTIIGLIAGVLPVHAQYGPGWFNSGLRSNQTIGATVENGAALQSSGTSENRRLGPFSSSGAGKNGGALVSGQLNNAADEITPEIADLARGLLYQPVKIYEHVKNHVDYEHYFGSKKGAHLTMLEQSGNDFDQCALLVALLRASGYDAAYQFGLMQLPYDAPDNRDLKHWLGFAFANTNCPDTYFRVASFVLTRGTPYAVSTDTPTYGFINTICFHRMWVSVTVSNVAYLLDPSFKTYTNYQGIDLVAATGFDKDTLMSTAGGTTNATTNSVSGLSEANIGTKLTLYTTSLLAYLRTNTISPNAESCQILGGRRLVPETITTLPVQLPFPECYDLVYGDGFGGYATMPVSSVTWANIPEVCMSTLGVGFSGSGTDFLMPSLKGQRLALTFETTNQGTLWLEDSIVFAQTVSTASNYVTVSITNNHFHGSVYVDPWANTWSIVDEGYNDQPADAVYKRSVANAIPRYVLLYSFNAGEPLLRKRQDKLDAYIKQGIPSTNRQVVLESLYVMGLNWMFQTELANRVVGARTGMMPLWHHRTGRMAQEEGFYIDVYAQLSSYAPADWNWTSFDTAYGVLAYFDSGLEHGVIEQMQGANASAASTIKMLQIANTSNLWIYLAGSNNYSSLVAPSLVNYSAAQLNAFSSYVNGGATILLAKNGAISQNHWKGSGYVTTWPDSLAMIISGNYFGGYSFDFGTVLYSPITTMANSDPLHYNAVPSTVLSPSSLEPVGMADGAYWFDHTDLALGGAEPRGISFARHYDSNRRFQNVARMGYGWTHNYNLYATEQSSVKAGLGLSTPQAMAPFLAATTAALGVYSNSVWAKERLLTALIAKWAVDQLRTNAVDLILGKDTLEFTRMPDGSFVPPAGQTATLTNVSGSYKLQLRHGNTFTFANTTNTLKPVTAISNWYGQSMQFTYDTSNRLSTVKDAFSPPRTLTLTYNSSNFLSTATTSQELANRQVSFLYDNSANLTKYTDPESRQHTYLYDANSLITSLLDPLNRVLVTNFYDTSARVFEQWNEGNSGKSWKYFWSGWCNAEEDPTGGRKFYYFDDKIRITALQGANGFVSRRAYDGQDHVVLTVGPSGESSRFVFDSFHNLLRSYDALGFFNSFGYDGQFHLVSATNARGFVSTFGYNAQHDLVAVTNASTLTNSFAYYPAGSSQAGLLQYTTDGDGFVSTNIYDSYGNPAAVLNPGGLSTNGFLFSARGDLLQITNALGLVITNGYNARREKTITVAAGFYTNSFFYDEPGNLSKIADGRGNVTTNAYSPSKVLLASYLPALPAGSPVIRHLYDSRDWQYAVVDPLNNTNRTVYDAGQRVRAAVDPLGRSVGFAYDASGRQIAVTNPLQQTTRMGYNARGEQTSITNALNNRVAFTFDNAGNRVAVTNRNNNTFTTVYDAAGRVATNLTPAGKATVLAYNARGLVTTNTEPSGQKTTNTYDALGRLIVRADAVGITTNRYNANNNVTNIIEALKTNRYDYDKLGRLTTCVDSAQRTNGYAYDANGNLIKLFYGANGTSPVTYSYDSHNRLTSVLDWTGRQTLFDYDLAGRLTTITRPNNTVRQMDYDAAGQLTNIVERLGNGTPIAVFRFQWDDAGRIMSEFRAPLPHNWSAPARSQVFDNDNRVTKFNNTTLTSDADGNLMSGPLRNGTTYTFTNFVYDARNRLVQTLNIQQSTPNYIYDPAGNRISARFGAFTNDFQVAPLGGVSQVLRMYPNWSGSRTFIYGQGLLYELDAAGNDYYYHYDQRGSTVAVTDGNGNIVYRAEYSPYGTPTFTAGNWWTPFQFNGRYGVQTDFNSLLYMRARYYSPDLCRFLNADPIGFSGGMNFYAYANGNPISFSDPFGLTPLGESDQVVDQFQEIFITGDTWLHRLLYTGELNPSPEVLEAATTAAGAYAYQYGALRGFFIGAGTAGKLASGTYMPGYAIAAEFNWTIEGGWGGEIEAGGGLQMRGLTTLVGMGTKPFVSEQVGLAGSYQWNESSGGFKAGTIGAQAYGGQANKAGGYAFTGDLSDGTVELGITYGNIGLGIIFDPKRLLNAFKSNLPDAEEDFSFPALPLPQRRSSSKPF